MCPTYYRGLLTLLVTFTLFNITLGRGCHRVKVAGISDAQITGVYYYKYEWNGRPAYVNECGSLQLFYYHGNEVSYWLVGPMVGKASGYVLAHDAAADPTLVEATWKQYSSVSPSWVDSQISFTCEEECAYLGVENGHLSENLLGPYELVADSVSDTPAFRHFSAEVYIHRSHSAAAGGNCSMWHFANQLGGTYSYLFSRAQADRPHSVRKWVATRADGSFQEVKLKWTCLNQVEFEALVASRTPATTTEEPEQETVTTPDQICGERQVTMGAAMILNGGTPSLEGKWPFVVALMNSNGEVKCSGVLLNANWILTAGHCISDSTVAEERVMLGVINTDEPLANSREHSILRAIRHPQFEWLQAARFQLLNDVGLIELTEPVTMGPTVQPICLQKSAQVLGLPGAASNRISSDDFDNCFTAGWGEQQYKGLVGGVLQDFHVTSFIEKVSCAETYFRSYVSWVPSSQTVCVQNNNKARICRGDSGSPLMCHSRGRWYVTGVASWSLSACITWRTNYPSMFTTIPEYSDWILLTMSS